MLATLNTWLVVLASESHGIPGSDWRAKVAVPVGVLIFLGSVYLLVRSNLGTKRGYLVTGTSLFGFMVIYASFWTFGAPGTPPATGPQNLPGQELDAYEDTWRAFAGDSLVADDPNYDIVKTYPEGFEDTPEAAGLTADFESTADTGSDDTKTFFSTKEGPLTTPPILGTWDEVDRKYAMADNGRPIIAVTYQQTYQIATLPPGEAPPEGDPLLSVDGARVADDESNLAPAGTELGAVVEDGESYTAFAYFDAGSPMFPSLVLLGLVILLFIIHAGLLARDEARERRERTGDVAEEPVAEEPVGAGAARS
jgi:hypothetical protein